ncbi:hypothetical protein [Acuticoccus kandeliae]|uniref:hypothetical protein n=1 Tax=Acuticoccus kandeliae TaxID=2073160 RepID=UPI000D3E37B8|nr:hypothetical protein [Acuticoccus kandeliae]
MYADTDGEEHVELRDTSPPLSEADAAVYIERMCTELASIADRSGLGFLAYLLEVAREEALLHAAPVAVDGGASFRTRQPANSN